MKDPLNHSITILRQISARSFLWSLLFLSFFVYPLAIFPQSLKIGQTFYFNLGYTISFPGLAILGLLAVPVLLFFRWSLSRFLAGAVIVFTFSLLVNIPTEFEYVNSWLILLAYATIPLAAAILLKYGYLSLRKIASMASALWFLQILLGTIALYRQSSPAGTPGNINWMAGLLLMLSPWVIWYFKQTAQRYVKNKPFAVLLSVLLWLLPTAFILYHCHSRAAWLAVLLFPLFLILIRLQRPIHKILLTSLFILVTITTIVAAYIWFPSPLLRVIEKDIRVPLWTGTAVMIAKHPLGIGSGLYQKNFTPFRRVSSYNERLYAADMTTHPHNELLNVGAQLGLPALLAFFIMISMIGRSISKDPLQQCARTSAYFVVILAMFDLLLVQVPTAFLGFFFLGLSWNVLGDSSHQVNKQPGLFIPRCIGAVLCSITALIICYFNLSHDFHLRKGQIKEEMANRYDYVDRPDKRQQLLEDAVSLYKKSLTPFNTIIPSYQIGRLSMKLPGETRQAETYLNRVAVIDPNFSHLNLLFGQLSIQQHNLAAAEHFFSRECNFYPRNEKSWQNMYIFSMGTNLYDRSISIDKHLRDIYRERARQNFGEKVLEDKISSFITSLNTSDLTDATMLANELLTLINSIFTDPLFLEISRNKSLPKSLFAGGFSAMDTATWRLRSTLLKKLEKNIGKLPVSPESLVSWYKSTIQIQKARDHTLPEMVWNNKAGSPLSAYLLFAMICELNQSPAIICLDKEGQPKYAYIFATKAAPKTLTPKNQLISEKTPSQSTIYQVDLLASTSKSLSAAAFKKDFHWIPGQTLVYYPISDFFLRNQILGTLVTETFPYYPQHPPSIRLLELFALTGSPPPPLSALTSFYFSGHLMRFIDFFEQLEVQKK
jgi:tetratricopeptide (TPR) repeat protein